MRIVDQNNLIKKFDFSSVISPEDNAQAITTIKSIIDSGNYFKNSPPFQTQENLFGRPETFWLKYRMSFLMSVFMYLGREVRVSNMMCWSYMTNKETHEDRDKLWHDHWHPTHPDAKMMSGIFYLHIPDDVEDRNTCGTEMAPNGPESGNKYFVTPQDYTWTIYPSHIYHRPGIPQSNNWRFILAVDIEYVE